MSSLLRTKRRKMYKDACRYHLVPRPNKISKHKNVLSKRMWKNYISHIITYPGTSWKYVNKKDRKYSN